MLRCSALVLVATVASAQAQERQRVEFFETKIRPVLVQYCYECHSAAAAQPKGGLRLDSRDAVLAGGESGPAVVPGKAEDSLLLAALRHESLEMPPGRKLPAAVIDDFAHWIRSGASDPRTEPPTADEAAEWSWKLIFAERKNWWSLQPLAAFKPPSVSVDRWSKNMVDRFVLTKLQAAHVAPADPAELEVLLRRLSFVLTGLPPTPEQRERFLHLAEADAERAIEIAVDELLASPHFGEHFARHWMDVIRYSDTYGYEWDVPAKGAWRFRDYLTRAFNTDVGFDQLVREQIAGDLLPQPRINAAEQLNESLIGPMFFHLGERRHGSSLQFTGIHQEMVNSQIDAFSKAFLATTVACARCHDHKLDAVSQRDYYALASVFMTPRWVARSIDTPERNAAAIERLKQLRGKIRVALRARWSQQARKFADELVAAFATENDQDRWRMALPAPDAKHPPKIDQLGDLGPLLGEMLRDDANIPKRWTQIAESWRKLRNQRIAENAKNYEVLADFSTSSLPEGWSADGTGMQHGYTAAGTPLIALTGGRAVERLLPRGYHTHALSPRLPGALYSGRLQDCDRTFVSVQVAGADWASPRFVAANALLTNSEQTFFTGDTVWKKFITNRTFQPAEWTFRSEITTAALDVNFPGPAFQVKTALSAREDGDRFNGWFSVTGIVKHDAGGAPQDPLDYWAALFADETPEDRAALARRVGDWLAGAVHRWCESTLRPGDLELLNWLIDHELLASRTEHDRSLARLTADYRVIEGQIAPPRVIVGMDERGMHATNYVLDVRGNYDDPGPSIAHDFLQVFAGENKVAESAGSGRLALADFVASPKCPLTARVYVNRVWQWVFGAGLSTTPDDFGHLGEKPSHPELLDALAGEFVARGWSTKKLLRQLVLSQTFRQSGEPSADAVRRDPTNRLLHHYPTRRLEAESIRDAILAASGRLDRNLYGPPVDPPRAKEDGTKRLFSGPLDGDGRRSIYTKICLMEPPKFLMCFNLPDPKSPSGKRDVTNVSTQALTLMNDPFVRSQAEFWAEHLIRRPDRTSDARLREMFLVGFGREPRGGELKQWNAFLQAATGIEKPTTTELLNSRQAWTEVAHLLFNSKEFIYYR
ncbi:MAG TPA: PSD1 and planctomycete cytochrome C domain-containing protein [Pirellulales bacterium]|nr:PSD1 and planctomycete cytochrome C domain-containing protein [Pirellulales bacterium]